MVRRYRAFFALLDWSQVPERDARRPWPGRAPHPRAAYVKALLVKRCEQQAYGWGSGTGLVSATDPRYGDVVLAERINRQAAALGIERPKVRNAQSVHRLNTLTYIVINARALQRARSLNASLSRPHALC